MNKNKNKNTGSNVRGTAYVVDPSVKFAGNGTKSTKITGSDLRVKKGGK